jgi:murein DD-endopeptidase MepM/ murein hydrolase activator NlpD
MKNITKPFIRFLNRLGETTIEVAVAAFRNFTEFLLLTLKLIWAKTIKVRTNVVDIARYLGILAASPFVKMSINLHNMRRDMRARRKERGVLAAAAAFFPYFGRFMFGKRGLTVTAFNYAAPILSVVFLLNVVMYATSANITLRLTVNGVFLGYIENEQTFLDAESFVLQRVNYFGSDRNIEMHAEFSIVNAGTNAVLTMNEVANQILEMSDFTLEYAYGFFIDGNLYGAIRGNEIHLIREAADALLEEYRTGDGDEGADEEVRFQNHVSFDEYDLFLAESIVEPRTIVRMITSTNRDGSPRLPVETVRTLEYDLPIGYETIYRSDDSLFEGSTSVVQQGANGINRVRARVSYLNGEETRRNIIQTTVVAEPTAKIIHRGSKSLGERAVSTAHAEYGMFIWPTLASGRISPGQHFRAGHAGIDIAGSGLFGTPIFAGANGVVTLSQHDYWGYGHTVIILHADGKRTLYAHCNELLVKVGDNVTQGEQIATLGTTGRSTGPHLHFEVIEAGSDRRLDPMLYLPR